ncbi:Uncharacterized protein HZ326_3188 [Fusarium oxysporum f. sp. albedinis]|nr:Uncharacterized protein HZ326_3188 [Fusarium oxysporum f. sp. albedinis]
MLSSRHIRYALWHDRECLGHRPAGQSCRSSRPPQDKNLYSIPLQALLCATGNSDRNIPINISALYSICLLLRANRPSRYGVKYRAGCSAFVLNWVSPSGDTAYDTT